MKFIPAGNSGKFCDESGFSDTQTSWNQLISKGSCPWWVILTSFDTETQISLHIDQSFLSKPTLFAASAKTSCDPHQSHHSDCVSHRFHLWCGNVRLFQKRTDCMFNFKLLLMHVCFLPTQWGVKHKRGPTLAVNKHFLLLFHRYIFFITRLKYGGTVKVTKLLCCTEIMFPLQFRREPQD